MGMQQNCSEYHKVVKEFLEQVHEIGSNVDNNG